MSFKCVRSNRLLIRLCSGVGGIYDGQKLLEISCFQLCGIK